jgi:2-keto-4-pentenoate hydratase/2-oxohepta-3-ene-1,7-dioic acid hydratase in catechol pathway
MRLVTYQSSDGPRAAAVTRGGLVDLNLADRTLPGSVREFLELGPEVIEKAQKAIDKAEPFARDTVTLLPPVPDPSKIICIGANYADHAAECKSPIPDEPIVFSKFLNTLAADGQDIKLPPESDQVDYEAELVVVIGKKARRIETSDALKYVAGYCCGNDISARDWQFKNVARQWVLGKAFDNFAPIGPELVTADELPEPNKLKIQLRLNGQTMQNSSTDQFLFNVETLVAYLSKVMTLLPGDLIFTGTPPGVGMGRDPQVFMKPGDQVEVEIEQIGTLTNRMI